ncbi:abortive phage infection protein [Azospirillum ramasamyi]|uniref:Abortive phage infection protein n=2 Tax=Azospirillum ramasamyi TaxID=682998 RepID=A0A2U9S5E7_9PROT|nr:abortive phage infection protein [Azospirillum ramasamyi]
MRVSMGVVQLRQIRNHLLERYVPYIDISDYEKRSQADQENAKLTRALSAFAIANEADLSPEVACTSVVDGYNDNGIDAIYYSAGEKVLYLCQSKWSNDGSGSLDEAGALKFVKGVLALLTPKFEDFNDKIRRRQAELDAAINNASRIVLISAHSGSDRLGDHANRVLSDCLSSLNDTGEVAVLLSLHQENLYTMVAEGGRGEPVNLAVQLFDWGATKNPYQAFYGQVAASDVAEWGVKHRHRIFFKNIRTFLGASTAVNEGIADSIKKSPQNFWYLNNGITALCSKIQKRAVGGNTRDAGTFDCEDVAIVNGAQTVGVITELSNISPEQLAQARVPIRLISLENCPEEFAMEVTRATNTQNRVDSRNFVALDPHQDRIRAELLVDGIEYEYRQGEGEPTGDRRFGLVDATVALACSRPEVDLAVQAKREISKLWEDMDRPPYRTMFNKGLRVRNKTGQERLVGAWQPLLFPTPCGRSSNR